MSIYHVEAEEHVGRPIKRRGEVSPPLLFAYAVKRADGSVAFRATSRVEAEELAWNLNNPAEGREAA